MERDIAGQGPSLFVAAVLLLANVIVYPALLLLPAESVIAAGVEDGPIENLGALSYFVAAVLCAMCFRDSRGKAHRFFGWRTQANIHFLLLGLFFFVCAGEEISWGQRIFGWDTPEAWQELNAQKETNLHNLWAFQAWNPDGSIKGQLELMLHPGRIIMLFWLMYCVIVPGLYTYSARARGLINAIGLPVPILFCGVLFLASYAARKATVSLMELPPRVVDTLSELQETSFAVIFALMALFFLMGLRLDRRGESGDGSLKEPVRAG